MKNHPLEASNPKKQIPPDAHDFENGREALPAKWTTEFPDLNDVNGEQLLDNLSARISEMSVEGINEWYGLLARSEDAVARIQTAAQRAGGHYRMRGQPVPTHVASALRAELNPFDTFYLNRLRTGDRKTQKHFVDHFSMVMRIKLRSKKLPSTVSAEVLQETFLRVLVCVREGHIRQPERLGAFVIAVCNNIVLETHRRKLRIEEHSHLDFSEPSDPAGDVEGRMIRDESKARVRQVFCRLSERDRNVLSTLVLEGHDKDDVCKTFGISRDYLRVLVYRAKIAFKDLYINHLCNARVDAPH